MQKKPITILIVDDSKVVCELLKYVIEQDPELKVVGTAEDGAQALKWLESHTCDVVTMDVQMPIMNGFEVTRKIMETKPIPIVIITSGYTVANTEMAFRAMEAGALAILEKPSGLCDSHYLMQLKELRDTIRTIAGVKLIKKKPLVVLSDTPTPPISIKEENIKEDIRAIAIGASLGGPPAISKILSELPSSLPVPIYIVQHIAAGFTEGFIKWLQEHCSLPILLAQDGQKALPGHIYVAPDKSHMEIKREHTISLDSTPSVGSQPSVGRLFRSMAYTYGSHCVGVILTGMGRDGAAEMLLMKQQGAYTIAQDEKSSTMFGMPREAIAMGAAHKVLPLDKIAQALIQLTNKQGK